MPITDGNDVFKILLKINYEITYHNVFQMHQLQNKRNCCSKFSLLLRYNLATQYKKCVHLFIIVIIIISQAVIQKKKTKINVKWILYCLKVLRMIL